mgnify:CR=1 FL=1
MPYDEKVATYAAGDPITPLQINQIQDRMDCLHPMTEEGGALPSTFRGASWLYGEFSIGPTSTVALDQSINIWQGDKWTPIKYINWRNRNLRIVLVHCDTAAELPSGVDHKVGTFVAADVAWHSFNTKAGGSDAALTQLWKPFAARNLYVGAYSPAWGNLIAVNTDVALTYYFYFVAQLTKSITVAQYEDHRIRAYADYCRVRSDDWNEIQRQAVFVGQLNKNEGAWSATKYLGGTWLYGQKQITNGTDALLDDSRDWRNVNVLGYACECLNTASLPNGATHAPDASKITSRRYTYHNTKGGDPIGGAFVQAWVPFAGVYLYADNANGYLYCSNTSGVTKYLFFDLQMSGKII